MSASVKRSHTERSRRRASFSGKIITITGAARGIGFATARYLAERGATVAICDILRDNLDQAVKRLENDFPACEIVSSIVDVCDDTIVEEWLLSIKNMYGRLDGCVNGAGKVSALSTAKTMLMQDPRYHWT
jgi:NAD(P)-dependent dehydrogenase (short-subunit alcohol dehydrogenase family)